MSDKTLNSLRFRRAPIRDARGGKPYNSFVCRRCEAIFRNPDETDLARVHLCVPRFFYSPAGHRDLGLTFDHRAPLSETYERLAITFAELAKAEAERWTEPGAQRPRDREP